MKESWHTQAGVMAHTVTNKMGCLSIAMSLHAPKVYRNWPVENNFYSEALRTRTLKIEIAVYTGTREIANQTPPIPYKGCSQGPKFGTYSDWGF